MDVGSLYMEVFDMPNWCNNTITITAPSVEIDRILENGPITFEKFYPIPSHIERGSIPYEEMKNPDNWYNWCIKHWGTKWDIDPIDPKEAIETGMLETDEADPELFGTDMWYVKFHFDTAWAPPEALFSKYAKDHPEAHIKLEYNELGMWFAGETVWNNGEIINRWEGEPIPNVHYDPDLMNN